MKMTFWLLLSLLCPTLLQAQSTGGPAPQTILLAPTTAGGVALQDQGTTRSALAVRTRWRSAGDSLFYARYNKYGDLRDDDPNYNPRRPWWLVALKVAGQNVATTSVDRYVFGYSYSKVGLESWKHNLKTGWEWDTDRFGMNFFLHPYSGAGYFNWARSSGYNFYQSIPFALGGSLAFEYFGENTLPSINDVINTPISGTFFGEVFYRLSSSILDDRTFGRGRFLRELAAGAVDPARGLGRLAAGKVFRHTPTEIYQKEPLNITLSGGLRKLNHGSSFGTGSTSATFNLHVDYGNPFEKRSRKPFDYFKVRTDLNYGVGRKLLDNITGLGIISGTNVQHGSTEMLVGLFQHYDYWDNKTFELGAIGFGGGVVSKVPLGARSGLYTNVHLGIVPLAGNSTQYGPDTLQVRDYNYGGGLMGKIESTLELERSAVFTFVGYYYLIHTYIGHKGDHYIGLIRPRVEVRFVNNLSLGFEHLVYYSDRFPGDFHPIHTVRTEQRVFLKILFEQFRRKD